MTDTVTVGRATRATYAAFAGSGFAFASWASRIPQLRDHLALSPAELGLVLLFVAAGSVTALPLSGVVVARIGSRRCVQATAVLFGAALVLVALAWVAGVWLVVTALYFLGVANGLWDVAMNVQGALVERRLGRSVMSRFHAGFSMGTVAGALLSAGLVALHVPATAHLATIGLLVALVVTAEVRGFLPDHGTDDDTADTGDGTGGASAAPGEPGGAVGTGVRTAWREPRTVLVGVFVLAFAFAEGTGNDWINVAVIDGYGASPTVAVLAFATFLAAMTVGRWFGPALLDRYGRVVVVRLLAALGGLGSLLFVLGPGLATAFVGAVLWGGGISLGFPVGMSAGADEPRAAAARVSVVASIGYCAFLAGPPVVGFLGDHATVLRALVSVSVLLAVAVLLADSVRPLGAQRRHAD
ncbi:Fucose permease [Jatrophihabitans endophyticus]|uniref:Fucose permease n=1 Tax=Jatrophihabitans endophyticus TaxID=1206085 RepID=A0A1M5M277_9ACTN|nr:MFS transporter [Jatrophihabitans endophyticus]SHG71336.1 Fucose permease [Jatrophihabitans endophyticus]